MVNGRLISTTAKGLYIYYCEDYAINSSDYIIVRPSNKYSKDGKRKVHCAHSNYSEGGNLPLVFESKRACRKFISEYQDTYIVPKDSNLGCACMSTINNWEDTKVYYVVKGSFLRNLLGMFRKALFMK